VAAKSSQQGDSGRPVVVVSNRLPFTFHRGSRGIERRPSTGGLVSALEPVVSRRGGTWVGWPGLEIKARERVSTRAKNYKVEPVLLSDSEVTRYYHGLSNRTLWPLCHSLPALARFERKDWQSYEKINERFARVTAENARKGELIWVHDYHLMLVPEYLRQFAPRQRLAFFLHIPFPPHDIFRLCPWDRQLLRGLLACDLIGFHVQSYASNFFDCVERLLGARVDRKAMVVELGDRISQVGVFPIGIDFDLFDRKAREVHDVQDQGGERFVLGVDRLDYTKGIPERIRAFERLLELHPRYREEVVLLQLAVPSRSQVAEYRGLKRSIDELVGRVNGRFATANWSPIRYLYRSISRDRLIALYREAAVGLVTPMRDGMNLVAKEFVASQVDDPGVLVLSRMAGAAETMHEALLVNPFDLDGTAEAIHRALTMDLDERASRMASLRRREKRDNVEAWVDRFLESAEQSRATIQPLSDSEIHSWLSSFLRDLPLFLFLDYDGTITPLREHPSKATMSREMRKVLESCVERNDTDVAVVSGRSLADVAKMVNHPDVIYAGNHGLEIEGPGLEAFHHEDLVHYRRRADALATELKAVEADGAWTEAKGPTLTYHYRQVPEAKRAASVEAVRRIMTEAGYQPRDAHLAVEARPPIGWDKGRAVLHILRSLYGRSWSEQVRVIYVGDDQTDEDAFRFLAGLAITFRVGKAETLTAAARRLPNVDAVRAVLDWLARRPAPGS
jgi:trehalose 6-phosphate synthase/phosphatase